MKVEIWSDFSCPFCYWGKRKFEKALNEFKYKENIEIVFKSYQLNPYLTDKPIGIGYEGFMKSKNVSLNEAKTMLNQVQERVKIDGLEYHMDKIQFVSTFNPHIILKYLVQFNKDKEFLEIMMDKYFRLGQNIADINIIKDALKLINASIDDIEVILKDKRYINLVEFDLNEAQKLGIKSVPFFIFNKKYAISGAQDIYIFKQILERSYEEFLKQK